MTHLKTKLFLPIGPDGSLTLPALLLDHLGITEDGLLGVHIPENPSSCHGCEELELSLTSDCEENLCSEELPSEDYLRLPDELLEAADLPSGSDLTAICFGGGILITSSETAESSDSFTIPPTEDILILPLKNITSQHE